MQCRKLSVHPPALPVARSAAAQLHAAGQTFLNVPVASDLLLQHTDETVLIRAYKWPPFEVVQLRSFIVFVN